MVSLYWKQMGKARKNHPFSRNFPIFVEKCKLQFIGQFENGEPRRGADLAPALKRRLSLP